MYQRTHFTNLDIDNQDIIYIYILLQGVAINKISFPCIK